MKTRRCRKAIILKLLVLTPLWLLAAGSVTYRLAVVWLKHEIRLEKERLRLEGHPMTFEEMILPRIIPWDENGATEFYKAFALLPKDEPDFYSLNDKYRNDMALAMKSEPEVFAPMLKQYEKFFPVFRKALANKRQDVFFDGYNISASPYITCEHLIYLRNCTNACRYDALFKAINGRPDEALNCLAKSLVLPEIMCNRQTNLVEYLTGVALYGINRGTSSDICRYTRPAPNVLRQLADEYERQESLQTSATLTKVLDAERLFFFYGLLDERGRWEKLDFSQKCENPKYFFELYLLYNEYLYMKKIEPFFAKAFSLPQEEMLLFSRCSSFEDKLNIYGIPTAIPNWSNCLGDGYKRFIEMVVYNTVHFRLAAVGLRLYADFLEGKPYPQNLDDFKPELVRDTFSGRKFLLERKRGELIVYSVGSNSIDDGGYEPPNLADPNSRGSKCEDDIWFRLPLVAPVAGNAKEDVN